MICLQAESVLSVFQNKDLNERVHEKLGLIDYTSTGWESVEQKPGVQRRQESYTLNRQISQFGSKVSCIQQITVTSEDAKKIVIDDMLTLHDVPFGDHFQVISLMIVDISKISCKCSAFRCVYTTFA
jgi:hypothetical protein